MFSWLRRGPARPKRSERKAVTEELALWASLRRGVEIYVEPKTAVTETSVVLVAHDGEFTRRRIASPKAAREFAHDNSLPIYDATVVGYPPADAGLLAPAEHPARNARQRDALGDSTDR